MDTLYCLNLSSWKAKRLWIFETSKSQLVLETWSEKIPDCYWDDRFLSFLWYLAKSSGANHLDVTYSMYKFDLDEAMVGYSLGVVGVLSLLCKEDWLNMPLNGGAKRKPFYRGYLLWIIWAHFVAVATEGLDVVCFFICPIVLGGNSLSYLQGWCPSVADNEQGELQGAFNSYDESFGDLLRPLVMTNLF